MKPGELLARSLAMAGVRRVFGMPGEDISRIWSALAASDLDLVMCRHELGAAAMATTHARLTGELSVLLVPGGPGASNLLTALANARVDALPMLVITGAGSASDIDPAVSRALEQVLKFSTTATSPSDVGRAVTEAAGQARSSRRGPCRLIAPSELFTGLVDAMPDEPAVQPPAIISATILDDAASRIRAARFPVIIAGRGASGHKAVKALRRLSDVSGLPVAATPSAKGVIDMESDASLMTIAAPVDGPVRRAILDADLVITVGVDSGELPESFLPLHDGRPLIELEGDLAQALGVLGERLGERALAEPERIAEVRRAVLGELEAHREDDAVGRLDPRKVIWDVRHVLGPHDILLTDVGAHGLWVQHYYPCHEPRTCLAPTSFRPMGTALPGAVAASLAYPDRGVVAIVGDGTLLVNMQEMETARRLGSSVVVIVWVDDAFGLVSLKGGGEAAGVDTRFGNPDFVMLAESFGWRGVVCDRARDLQDILRKEVDIDEPSLVAIPVDYRDTAHLLGR